MVWEAMGNLYGELSVSDIFLEFKKALAITLPSNDDPTRTIDEIAMQLHRMSSQSVYVPSFIQGMILAAKIPGWMQVVHQGISQFTNAKKIDFEEIAKEIRLAWSQRASNRAAPQP